MLSSRSNPLKQIFYPKPDDQLFDILEDEQNEQEDAILRSGLQAESSRPNDASNDGSIHQVYLLPIKPEYKNKFLFNITLKLAGEGINRPRDVLLTLRKASLSRPNDQCKIVVHKQSNTIANGPEQMNQTNSSGLVEIGALEATDLKSNTSNLLKYTLNKLIGNAFESNVWWPAAGEERLLLFTAVNCDFESAMLNIKYETIQVTARNKPFIGENPESVFFFAAAVFRLSHAYLTETPIL